MVEPSRFILAPSNVDDVDDDDDDAAGDDGDDDNSGKIDECLEHGREISALTQHGSDVHFFFEQIA